MRICYITTISLSIKSFFQPQLRFLAQKGFDVTVICSEDPNLQEMLGNTIRYIPVAMPRGLSLFGSICAVHKLIKIFKKEKFDFLQYSTPNASLYAAIAASYLKVPIRNYHMMGLRYLGYTGIFKCVLKIIEKYTCRLSTHIECVSNSNLELGISERIFKRDKVTVVWNGSTGGVDLHRFDFKQRQVWRETIRRQLNIGTTEFVFGFVGRVTRDKGINEILQSFACLLNCKLLMIGTAEDTASLNQHLYQASLHNPDIYFVGPVTDVEMYYAAIDVLLLPSYREGFGNVVIESAAMGIPSIISNIPGPIDAVIPNRTAVVVDKYDVGQLQKAMQRLLDNQELVIELGEQARQFVTEKFDSSKLLLKIYERKLMLLSDKRKTNEKGSYCK